MYIVYAHNSCNKLIYQRKSSIRMSPPLQRAPPLLLLNLNCILYIIIPEMHPRPFLTYYLHLFSHLLHNSGREREGTCSWRDNKKGAFCWARKHIHLTTHNYCTHGLTWNHDQPTIFCVRHADGLPRDKWYSQSAFCWEKKEIPLPQICGQSQGSSTQKEREKKVSFKSQKADKKNKEHSFFFFLN